MASSRLHYYVINLPQCYDRKDRLTHRLKYHDILEATTFIDAVDRKSPLVEWFEEGITHPYRSSRSEHACFLSHIKALRAFVADPNVDEAIIMEDDAMLHNDFKNHLNHILSRKPKADLIMLSYLAASWDGVFKVPDDQLLPSEKYLANPPEFFTITPKIFNALGYWLNKDYAYYCLARLDKSLRQISEDFVTSELITRLSGGFFISPPLIIEEGVYSTLRQGDDLAVHRKFYAHFGIENYSNAELVQIQDIWKPIGYNPLDLPDQQKISLTATTSIINRDDINSLSEPISSKLQDLH